MECERLEQIKYFVLLKKATMSRKSSTHLAPFAKKPDKQLSRMVGRSSCLKAKERETRIHIQVNIQVNLALEKSTMYSDITGSSSRDNIVSMTQELRSPANVDPYYPESPM